MAPDFDDRDAEIVAARLALLDKIDGPRVGDYVDFADGTTRRISHDWGPLEDGETHGFWGPATGRYQTSDTGSYYLGDGYVSMSGGLFPALPAEAFTATDETREARVWIFHHDHWCAGNGVTVSVPVRVFTCDLDPPK